MNIELNWLHTKNYKNSGVTIGYRRVAGKIGLTNHEDGIRGAWVEKRITLLQDLLNNNAKLTFFSPPTKQTANAGLQHQTQYKHCDILFLEFGGTNLQFYKKDWEQTINIIKNHIGKICFINDDPDLPFLWNLLPNENWSRWSVLANATNSDAVSKTLKTPAKIQVHDYEMIANHNFAEYINAKLNKIVYIGRPNGRTKYFNNFTQAKNLLVAGKPNEWVNYPNINITEIPEQKNRRNFYRKFAGCLAVYDDKHKLCGWRTGRAYHALYAGIPVLAPVGNRGLDWAYAIQDYRDIDSFTELTATDKKNIWEMQKSAVLGKKTSIAMRDILQQ